MSCEDGQCGTGIGNPQPKPGDPSNDVSLRCNNIFSGIQISWRYPSINPNAVQYTLLYRSTSAKFSDAIEVAHAAGSVYFDHFDQETSQQFWYWIKVVSVNGTVGELVGPASIVLKPRKVQTVEDIQNSLTNNAFTQVLREDILKIGEIGLTVEADRKDRISADAVLAEALNRVQTGLDASMTYINTEITNRKDADSAQVSVLNTLGAAVDKNSALIFNEQIVRAEKDLALAKDITQLYANVADNAAALTREATVRADKDTALASDVTQLYARTADNVAAIQAERIARTNALGALSSTIDTVQAKTEDNRAAIQAETVARTNAISAQASQITTLNSVVNGNSASGQVGLTTKVDLNAAGIASLGGQFYAKFNVNGYISGFTVYNTGYTSAAIFDVDSFFIGRLDSGATAPFIVDNGVTYISQAKIRDADITTLKIAGNAVNIPTYLNGNNVINDITPGRVVTLANQVVNYPYDTTLVIITNWSSNNDGVSTGCELRIAIDGKEVLFGEDSSLGGYPQSHSFSTRVSVSAGNHLVTVTATNGYFRGAWRLTQWGVLLLGIMR